YAHQAVGLILSVVCVGGAQTIMLLRVHALFGRNKTLRNTLVVLFAAALTTELLIAIIKLSTDHIVIQTVPSPLLIEPVNFCNGKAPRYLLVYPGPMMAFDLALLCLVVIQSWRMRKEQFPGRQESSWSGIRVLKVMFRDSVIYFAW
ncbi:unnamed protein product, partial [Mycena citricolor]